MRIVTLYSGSGGNSVYIEAAGEAILIDAGKNARALCNSLSSIGADIGSIKAIFITHEHNDHISALNVLSKRHCIPIHMTEYSAVKFDFMKDAAARERIVRHDIEYEETVGGMCVRSFRTPHDSLMSVGYRVEFSDAEGKHAIGVATDMGYVSETVRRSLYGCEAVVLESNHDVEMLEMGSYPYDLKKRILSKRGHLSNAESAELAAELVGGGARGFLLAHLSEENNTPDLALDAFISAVASPDVFVAAAAPDAPTELFLPGRKADKIQEARNGQCKAVERGNA